MEDEVAAGHRRREGGEVEVVAAHEPEAGLARSALSKESLLAGGEIIPADNGDAVRQEAVDEGGANEAPAAPVTNACCI